ncbi:MAG: class B sortase [Anaerovoracaceae bacterium]
MKIFKRIILIILIGVFLFSAYKLVDYYLTGMKEEDAFKQIRQTEDKRESLASLMKKNPDTVGWIKIDGTKIDYPVMQNMSDNEYYLRKNFNKEYSLSGSIFMDISTVIGKSRNLLIYGHNMKNGTMFHSLVKYEDEKYWQEHKDVTFETKKGKAKYQVVAGGKEETLKSAPNEFKYYKFPKITNDQEHANYLKGIQDTADFAKLDGITPKTKLITLSTCSYHAEDKAGRYFIVAKEVK